MKPTPARNISKLSYTELELELYQWQRLADYSDSSSLNFYLSAGRDRSLVSENDAQASSGKKIMTILGVIATLVLCGSALWCRSVEGTQSYEIDGSIRISSL